MIFRYDWILFGPAAPEMIRPSDKANNPRIARISSSLAAMSRLRATYSAITYSDNQSAISAGFSSPSISTVTALRL